MMPERTIAPAASRPATAGGTRPVASSTTIATRMTIACRAPGPSGTAWRRTSSGELTTSTSGSARWMSSAFQVPCRSRVSPAWRTTLPFSCAPATGAICSPPRCTARMIRSPLSVTMPGKTAWPIRAERGEISTSASPERALNSASSPLPAACSSRKARCMRRGEVGGLLRVAAQEQRVARLDLLPGGAACRCPCPGRPSARGRGRRRGRCSARAAPT